VFDVIVVGAGVVGTAAAYRSVQHGAHTLLIDGDLAGRATQVAAGIVSPTTVRPDAGPTYLLAQAARAFLPALVRQLCADGAPASGYAKCGEILIAQDDSQAEALGDLLDALASWHADINASATAAPEEISPAEAKTRVPVLADVARAAWVPDAARVDGNLLNQAMRTAAQERGLEVLRDTVTGFMFDGKRVSGVRLGDSAEPSSNVIIACGAWSHELCLELGVPIGVKPQRGQLIHLDLHGIEASTWPLVRTIHDHYIVPWPDGRVVVGATNENDAGWDARRTAGGIAQVLANAMSLAPGLRDATFLESRVGLRPVLERGYPMIGSLPGIDRCFIATGHGSEGLAYGPWSGYAIADHSLDVDINDLSAFAM
jgi:D-amino-acid dehydrogenase